MNRWIVRLGVVGLLVVLGLYIWSRMNEDYDEDDLEDEIPIEFDVPLEQPSAGAPEGPAAETTAQDTGVGPGEDRQPVTPGTEDGTQDGGQALSDASDTGGSGSSSTTGHDHDDLTVLRGIGPVFQERLHELGIRTFRDLADADPGRLEESLHGVGVDVPAWIAQARELAGEHNS